jgi:hypothetical protein
VNLRILIKVLISSLQSALTMLYTFHKLILLGRDSSVGTVTRYRLDSLGIESRRGEIFHICPDRPWGPSIVLCKGYRVSFRGVKRPGRVVNHLHLSNGTVKERVELCLYSSPVPSWPVLCRVLTFM